MGQCEDKELLEDAKNDIEYVEMFHLHPVERGKRLGWAYNALIECKDQSSEEWKSLKERLNIEIGDDNFPF